MVNLELSDLFNSLLEPTINFQEDEWIDLYRLFCYGFRCGGFVDIVKQAIEEIIIKNKFNLNKDLLKVNNNLQEILGLRTEPIPKDKFVIRRFFHYLKLFNETIDCLGNISENEKIKPIYETLKFSIELVTNSKGLYILDWNNQFFLKNGAIDLPDQHIKILQGLFTDFFSLNYALVSPGSKFYHGHSILWEYHFIDDFNDKCYYEHFRAGKKFQIQDIDIISMSPGIPHGGYNPPNSIPVMLGFVAGNTRYGPWRFDFNDRSIPVSGELSKAKDIKELNGVLLTNYIEKLKYQNSDTRKIEVIFPHKECEVNLELIKVRKTPYKLHSNKDCIIKVIEGDGKISIGNKIKVKLHPHYSFTLPSRIEGTIESENMILINFC